ncbi:MAG: hypothetical protein ABH828_05000 [archaeon]
MLKRGQQPGAGGAAVLVIIIAAVIVLYILFLPPEDRAELLGENSTTTSSGDETSSGINKTLLKEPIGRLDYLSFDYKEHDIPSFRIYSEKAGTSLKTIPSLYVKGSVGEMKDYNLSFDISKSLTSNVQISFNVKTAQGRLELYLNGHEIFNGAVSKGSPAPIALDSDYLEKENVLTFKVVKPSWFAFWRTNEYLLENVILSADILDISHSSSRQFFYVSEVEVLNLDEVKLKFYPTCASMEVGPLLINLNGEETFSGVADCGVYNTIILDKATIFEDRNELEFISTEGSYFIDRVSVKTELKDLKYPVYYFDIDEELFIDDELDENYNVTLTLRFVNDDEKRLEYLINGKRRYIRTDELKYSKIINDDVIEGTNSLELIAKSEAIDIAEMKVFLDEKD